MYWVHVAQVRLTRLPLLRPFLAYSPASCAPVKPFLSECWRTSVACPHALAMKATSVTRRVPQVTPPLCVQSSATFGADLSSSVDGEPLVLGVPDIVPPACLAPFRSRATFRSLFRVLSLPA
ncbi:hypothetical protein DFH09DRAFT_1418255 [Mycena vulgaris]|nr:hypothetical protein DFH09DRAFT_1418255 [Mycena vulgaris]